MRASRTRRGLLASLAAGSASLAGCGYQPAGGELAWTESVGGPGFRSADDGDRWFADGEFLYRITNRSGMEFDVDDAGSTGFTETDDAAVTAYGSSGQRVRSTDTAVRYAGEPTVAAGRVYLPLENGSVTALERAESTEETADRTDEFATLWTTKWNAIDGVSDEGTSDEPNGETETNADDGTGTNADESDRPPALTMVAGSELVAGYSHAAVVAFDAATGDERFALEADELGATVLDRAAVAGDQVWVVTRGSDDEPTAFAIEADGTVTAEVALPSSADWLETTSSMALLGLDGELWALDAADRRFTLPLDGDGTPLVVGDRLYYDTAGSIVAVDIDAGERAWRRDGYRLEAVAADADGVYAVGSGPDTEGCALLAFTSAGEPWWQVPMLDDVGCRGELFAVRDRLVLRVDADLYGFRREPGTRYTIL